MVVSVIMIKMMVVMMVMSVMMMIVIMIVIMVMVVVAVRDLLLSVDADGKMGRSDAAAGDRLADEFDARDVKGVQLGQCLVWVGLEFEKCGCEHVARSAH